MGKISKLNIVLIVLFLVLITFLGYAVKRTDEWLLLGSFAALFGFYIYWAPGKGKKVFNFKQVLLIAVFARVALLFMMPNLSDDYFRFIWDGNLVIQGENPFEFLPSEHPADQLDNYSSLKEAAYWGTNPNFPDGMNSKNYYSVYPPVNQAVFAISAAAGSGSTTLNVIFLRLFIILFDIGLILIMGKLLVRFKMEKSLVFWYALNPLVILELTGNLHFEGVTLYFVLLAIWLLVKQKTWQAGLFYAMAIGTKLVPILFLPFFLLRLQWKKLALFYVVIGVSVVLMFIPFMGVNLQDTFGESIRLYFKSFEFNASFYYLFRSIGYSITGYNQIAVIGSFTPIIVLLFALILIVVGRKEQHLKHIFKYLLGALLIYYLMASIVHPWYTIYLLAIAVFTNYRFPMLWTGVVVLSYWAYRTPGAVEENIWLIGLSYASVLGYAVWEWWNLKKKSYING